MRKFSSFSIARLCYFSALRRPRPETEAARANRLRLYPPVPRRSGTAQVPGGTIIASESILGALGESPEVEDEELGRAYVNVRGLEAH